MQHFVILSTLCKWKHQKWLFLLLNGAVSSMTHACCFSGFDSSALHAIHKGSLCQTQLESKRH